MEGRGDNNSGSSPNFIINNHNERNIGVNISMPINMLIDIDNIAKKEGITRSQFVRNSINNYIQMKKS